MSLRTALQYAGGLGLGAMLFCVALLACGGGAPTSQPLISPSADASPRWQIDLHRVVNGIYRTYGRRCIDTVRMGHTVEFRNYEPEVPANVTAIAQPHAAEALYSPNLVRPYNYAQDEAHPYSYWRYTFEVPGVYDYVDTNLSQSGRQVVDAYYGTVTFVGIDPNTPIGTICVRDENGKGCEGVCCSDDTDCNKGQQCFVTELDNLGRCLSPSE